MLRLLQERAKKGVRVRVIGRMIRPIAGIEFALPRRRLHVRAIVRDGSQALIGSQSLRALELDRRREVGVIVRARPIVKRLTEIFEEDWQASVVDPMDASPAVEAIGLAAISEAV